MKRKISLWLLPVSPQALLLSQQIKELSGRSQSHPFASHMTLYSPIVCDPEALRQSMEPLCQETSPFHLMSTGIGHSEAYYRSIVIEIVPDPELLALNHKLKQQWNPGDPRPYAPHISLVYQELSESKRLDFLPGISSLPEYHFDRLTAIATESSDPAGHNFQEWEPLWTLPLMG